jgi:hypothetical protein
MTVVVQLSLVACRGIGGTLLVLEGGNLLMAVLLYYLLNYPESTTSIATKGPYLYRKR